MCLQHTTRKESIKYAETDSISIIRIVFLACCLIVKWIFAIYAYFIVLNITLHIIKKESPIWNNLPKSPKSTNSVFQHLPKTSNLREETYPYTFALE